MVSAFKRELLVVDMSGGTYHAVVPEGLPFRDSLDILTKKYGGGVATYDYGGDLGQEIVAVVIGKSIEVKGEPEKVSGADFSKFDDPDYFSRICKEQSLSSEGGIHFFLGESGIPIVPAMGESGKIGFLNSKEVLVTGSTSYFSIRLVNYNSDPQTLKDLGSGEIDISLAAQTALSNPGSVNSPTNLTKEQIEKAHGGARGDKLMLDEQKILIFDFLTNELKTALEYALPEKPVRDLFTMQKLPLQQSDLPFSIGPLPIVPSMAAFSYVPTVLDVFSSVTVLAIDRRLEMASNLLQRPIIQKENITGNAVLPVDRRLAFGTLKEFALPRSSRSNSEMGDVSMKVPSDTQINPPSTVNVPKEACSSTSKKPESSLYREISTKSSAKPRTYKSRKPSEPSYPKINEKKQPNKKIKHTDYRSLHSPLSLPITDSSDKSTTKPSKELTLKPKQKPKKGSKISKKEKSEQKPKATKKFKSPGLKINLLKSKSTKKKKILPKVAKNNLGLKPKPEPILKHPGIKTKSKKSIRDKPKIKSTNLDQTNTTIHANHTKTPKSISKKLPKKTSVVLSKEYIETAKTNKKIKEYFRLEMLGFYGRRKKRKKFKI